MEIQNNIPIYEEYSICPNCGHEDLFLSYDETIWCPECGWHEGISCKEFICPDCGSYEICYEENRAVCKECGCTVAFECDGIVKREDKPGQYKILRVRKAELLSRATRLCKCFSEFTELEEIILPDRLEVISYDAFSGCVALRSINIPQSVRLIDYGAFQSCAFTNIQLPEGITEIRDFTFLDCSKLKKITIPAGVTSIGIAAFQYCNSLEEIILPKNLEKISNHAFYGCTSLKHILIPKGTVVDTDAFGACPDIVIERG